MKTIFVYDGSTSIDPVLIGKLHISAVRGEETCSFEYAESWLNDARYYAPDPELQPYAGRQFPVGRKLLFGAFEDAIPDRWGRRLMDRRERILAQKEGRKPGKLQESDYLLGVYDETRMGGLRFKTDPEGPFLSPDEEQPVPPLARLRSLEEASRNYEQDEGGLAEKWVRQLIGPGSSLGGARPKVTAADEKGGLWIAKFPSKNDENDSGAWEKVVHDLAGKCGLTVPEARLERFSRFGSTYLVKRFDREGTRRIHYSSAMTLLGRTDGEAAAEGVSYLDIASFIRANGARPKADLTELWKRIVFSMMVTNTDDHLRNHAFLLTGRGWVLSPLFDVNPVPYGNELALNINETDNTAEPELALEVAERFGIRLDEAKETVRVIRETVKSSWPGLAKTCGLSRGQIEAMRPAFPE